MMRFLVLISAMLVFVSCGLFRGGKKDETKKADSKAPQLVGRIASVSAGKQFVLVQNYGVVTFESGTILTTRGPDERSANLKVTGEKLGKFLAADIQAGTLEVGDGVYSHHVPKPKGEGISPQSVGGIAPGNEQLPLPSAGKTENQ